MLLAQDGRSINCVQKERNDESVYPVEASGILYKYSTEMFHLERVLLLGKKTWIISTESKGVS